MKNKIKLQSGDHAIEVMKQLKDNGYSNTFGPSIDPKCILIDNVSRKFRFEYGGSNHPDYEECSIDDILKSEFFKVKAMSSNELSDFCDSFNDVIANKGYDKESFIKGVLLCYSKLCINNQ